MELGSVSTKNIELATGVSWQNINVYKKNRNCQKENLLLSQVAHQVLLDISQQKVSQNVQNLILTRR